MIETLLGMFLLFLLFGAVTYLILCVDPNNTGPLGYLHRFIFKRMPGKAKDSMGGEESWITKKIGGFFEYLCNTNHPLVQYFYIMVSPGGFVLYWFSGFNKHFDENSQVASYHKFTGFLIQYLAVYTYYLACKTGPGKISKGNCQQYIQKYKHCYDDILYQKNNKCKTCDFVKPPRSKHCSTCKMCVSRFDHHCIWIRQCVGEKNYKHFLSFLAMHAVLTFYGFALGMKCLYGVIVDQQLLDAKFKGPNGEVVDATWSIIIRYLFYKETFFVFIIILCFIMCIALTLFYVYHLTLVHSNLTTNEKIKRSDCMNFLKKRIKEVRKKYETCEEEDKKKEMLETLDMLTKDFVKLDKWHGRKSLYQSLKEIYNN